MSTDESHRLDSTSFLFRRIRAGDADARERLFARVLPSLTAWAHRRLPAGARDLHETDDLVQLTLFRAFHRLETFESQGQGAFLGYLRRVLLNLIRDDLRRAARRGVADPLDEALPDLKPSPLEEALGIEMLERYERGLAALSPDQQEAVIMRIELEFSYAEIASILGTASADATRKMIGRTLVRLAEGMCDDP